MIAKELVIACKIYGGRLKDETTHMMEKEYGWKVKSKN
jgi:hypothetical protein